MEKFPLFENRPLPPPPHWKKVLGVGLIVMGLVVGTGELIMWPHLVTKYGLGILWAAFLGISFQYFINQEVARQALATGESFFTASTRVLKWLAPLWFVSAFILYIWPGWAGALGTTLSELFGFGNHFVWAWLSLALVLILTFSGKIAYAILEKTLKIIIPAFFILLLIVSFLNLKLFHFKEAFLGLINFGWVPENIDFSIFLAAIVFAGAGGLLNLCVSLWYRDKQTGMGRYVGQITNPITGHPAAVSVKGYVFETNAENLKKWKHWMKLVKIDQGIIFWFLGLITIILISLNAYAVLTPKGLVPEGLNVAVAQAHIFGDQWGIWGFKIFLLMTFLMLFSTMWAVIDAFTRIISDILYVNSQTGPFKKYLSGFKNISLHHFYYGLIMILVIIQAILIPFNAPLSYLTISAVLGGLAMAIYIPILLYINNRRLAKPLRPGWITNIFLFLAFIFYLVLSIQILIN
ncbi:Nramp family divalent metal transporter [Candidatus Wolfebacteria bacterium]|nr:Nramp family divalent metal transporter [Candidatus Wolfebacteria bacterium]